MRTKRIVVLAMMLIIPALLFTVSCAKKVVESKPAVVAPPPAPKPEPAVKAPDKAAEEAERLRAQELERQRERERLYKAAVDKFVNENVHFEFDSSVLRPEYQSLLAQKADFLRANAAVTVTIEGHCDDRGTDAYNMALGERRAEAVKAYLVNLGILENRLTTISYGEEQPIDPGRNEAAYAKNRRAHLAIN